MITTASTKLTWLHANTAGPSSGIRSSADRSHPIDRVGQQPGEKTQQKLGHEPVDIDRDCSVHQRGHQEKLWNRQAGFNSAAAISDATTMNTAFRMLFAATMRATRAGPRASGSAHRAAPSTARRRMPAARDRRRCASCPGWRRIAAGRPRASRERRSRKVQVDREDRHPDRAERHQTDLDAPAGQAFAGERTSTDTDRKHREQDRDDDFGAAKVLACKRSEACQEHRAEEPQPGDSDDRIEDRGVAVRDAEIAPRFGERIPVDRQRRIGGRRVRHELRGDATKDCAEQAHRRRDHRASGRRTG